MRTLLVTRYRNSDSCWKYRVMEDGKPVSIQMNGSPFARTEKSKILSEELGLDLTVIKAATRKFEASGLDSYDAPIANIEADIIASQQESEKSTEPAPDPLVITMRDINAPRETAVVVPSIGAAISEARTNDTVIQWNDIKQLCSVDVDWHGVDSGIEEPALRTLIEGMAAAPYCGWRTRNKGVRLIYTGPDADLLGALGAVEIVSRYAEIASVPPTLVELKTDTRHPGSAGLATPTERSLASIWHRDDPDEIVDPEIWHEWLGEAGLSIGRHSHDKCVIDPDHQSQSPNPVEVRVNGIMCHSCNGATGKGFRSAAFLMKDSREVVSPKSPLANIVRSLTHYEHAQYVLRTVVPDVVPDKIMKLYYRALLVAYHGMPDDRIESVFRDRFLIRLNGTWATDQGEPRKADQCKVAISNLPTCSNKEGERIAERVELLMNSIDLTSHGYPAIQPVFGCRVATHFPRRRWDDETRRPNPTMVIPPRHSHPPQYVMPSKRIPRDEAWGKLREVYPDVSVDLIEMLIYSRGLVERGCRSLHPKFLFNGVSGSGKTGHVHLAAAICGDRCTDITAVVDEERFCQKVMEAMRVGSFAAVNEVIKAAKKSRIDPRTFLDFVLTLTPESSAHVLYTGQTRFGWLPVLCLTDTDFPDDVLGDEQLGRRLLYRHVGHKKLNWEISTRKFGLSRWDDPRSAEDGGDVRKSCDAILSHVIDRYFKGDTIRDLTDVADELDFKFLNAEGHAQLTRDRMKDLFIAWQKYRTSAQYSPERGMKVFAANESGDLARAWERLHDPGSPCEWSRRNERPWAEVIGHPRTLLCKVEAYSRGNNSVVSLGFTELVDGTWKPITEVEGGGV